MKLRPCTCVLCAHTLMDMADNLLVIVEDVYIDKFRPVSAFEINLKISYLLVIVEDVYIDKFRASVCLDKYCVMISFYFCFV
jgi:hypothetical protein